MRETDISARDRITMTAAEIAAATLLCRFRAAAGRAYAP
jgi:hypothetical protein